MFAIQLKYLMHYIKKPFDPIQHTNTYQTIYGRVLIKMDYKWEKVNIDNVSIDIQNDCINRSLINFFLIDKSHTQQ